MSIASEQEVERFRAFNRFHTTLVGALDEHLLDTPYTLTEARVLFELGRGAPLEVVELRRRTGIDAGYLSRILASFERGELATRRRSEADARRVVVELDGRRAGCVLCVRDDDATARLRILLVEPWARGHGLGTRLVDECIAFARGAGYARLVLWTNDVLVAARRIYERAGFMLLEQAEHRAFGQDLVEQTWTLELQAPSR